MRKITNEELGRKSVEEFQQMEKLPVCLVVDNVRSIHNIGAFFRTADAFAVEKIVLCGICATPPSREIHKTALGAELSVNWSYFEDSVEAVKTLKAEGYRIVSIEQVEGAVLLDRFAPQEGERYALVVGNEVKGVRQEVVDLSDEAIEIPQSGTKHSLNVSVAAGVVLWHFFNKINLK